MARPWVKQRVMRHVSSGLERSTYVHSAADIQFLHIPAKTLTLGTANDFGRLLNAGDKAGSPLKLCDRA